MITKEKFIEDYKERRRRKKYLENQIKWDIKDIRERSISSKGSARRIHDRMVEAQRYLNKKTF